MTKKIIIKTSARHIHLSESDLERLFGKGYQLTKKVNIDQPGQFAAQETLAIKGPKGRKENVRIVGPTRERTQVEISKTDAINLGIDPPIAKSTNSNDVKPAKIELISAKTSLEIPAAIIAHRHIHLSPDQAKELNLNNNDKVEVKVRGKRALIFKNVLVRVDKNYNKSMHIDTDEANAAGISKEKEGEILN
jgi:putative phosphotransacetylase